MLVLEREARRSRSGPGRWPLISYLRRERVDVIHAHKFGSNLWGSILGRLTRVPVVIAHEHSWSYAGQPLRRFLDREVIARGADVIVAVSRKDQRRMTEVEKIEPATIRFIPNGIAPPERSGHDLRAELGIADGAPVVATVGQLRPEKALGVLIEAAKHLVPRFPELRVLIVGHGPVEHELRRLVAEASLEHTVLFLGRRSDVPDVLDAIDVAVCCSDFEGSPLSVMEYMAAGRPVVATRVGESRTSSRTAFTGSSCRPAALTSLQMRSLRSCPTVTAGIRWVRGHGFDRRRNFRSSPSSVA